MALSNVNGSIAIIPLTSLRRRTRWDDHSMATAGYSGKPLTQKLGIKEAHKIAVVGAPPGFDLGVLPTGATLQRGLAGKAPLDVLVVFVTRRSDLVARIGACRPRMRPAAGLWIAWP